MICPYCQMRAIPVRRGGHPPVHCGHVLCRQARRRATNAASHEAQRVRRKADRRAYRDDGAADIDRRLAAVTAARVAEERRMGRRRFTIETGWLQRPGAGEINANADVQGWGFA